MLVHGVCPNSMTSGTMVPIPKGSRKLLSNSDNYRAITLSSIISKIFDWVILIKENDALISSNLQFGFKEHVSTTHCTFTMSEIISHYNFNRSNVYCMLLDATKAFDRVNYCKLFRKLMDKKMSPLVLRLLLFMYTNQCLIVRWGAQFSDRFNVCNGVKQGGVLSPILFSVYMDGLFGKLEESGIGCRIGNLYAGGLGYADDLTLLVPSRKGLQKLIHICEAYALDYDVLFNGAKSQFLIFRGRDCQIEKCTVSVNNVNITNVNKGVHLGHNLSTVDSDSMVTAANAHFWRSFNLFHADFGNIHPFVKCKLFKQYCSSFYGAPLWLLSSHAVNNVCVSWRKALRKVWRLSPMTHCNVITLLSECYPLDICLKQRFCKFTSNILKYGSVILRSVMKAALKNPFSTFCKNYTEISSTCDSQDMSLCHMALVIRWYDTVPSDCKNKIGVLHDMIDVRDEWKKCDVLNIDEVHDIIEDICLN